VQLTSAIARQGLALVRELLAPGRTAALIGPSGAGKSTLVNALLGEERQATREIRVGDGRGRHTTVVRELIPLPGGGMIIDTPGLRALALTGSESGIEAAFSDVEELAAGCRFRDCAHSGEPDCAVAAAVAAGTLPEERLHSYHKLMREARVAAAKTDARLRAEEQRKWKTISKAARRYYRQTGRS
jgi:ribosome biogenesis GTPase